MINNSNCALLYKVIKYKTLSLCLRAIYANNNCHIISTIENMFVKDLFVSPLFIRLCAAINHIMDTNITRFSNSRIETIQFVANSLIHINCILTNYTVPLEHSTTNKINLNVKN